MRNSIPSLAVLALCAGFVPAVAPRSPLDDATIVAIFDAANTADIESGQLAAERAKNPKVRDYGRMIAHDHEAVRQQGRDLARKLGVKPTPPTDRSAAKAHEQAMKELRATSGADFDRAFLAHEVAFHQQVIDDIKNTLLPAIKNGELRTLVQKVAPAFQAHLIAAQQLQKEIGATTATAANSGRGSGSKP